MIYRPIERMLREVRSGHAILVRFPPAFLGEKDGPLAISIVQHLLGARGRAGLCVDQPFPATEDTLRAVAAKLGHRVSIKRCREMRRRLISAGVLQEAGDYRQGYTRGSVFKGYRVPLFRVIRASLGSLRSRKRPPGTPSRVKGRKRGLYWFETVLGSLDGRAPPGMDEKRARKMITLDDLRATGSVAA